MDLWYSNQSEHLLCVIQKCACSAMSCAYCSTTDTVQLYTIMAIASHANSAVLFYVAGQSKFVGTF